jgi:hypothetical protein
MKTGLDFRPKVKHNGVCLKSVTSAVAREPRQNFLHAVRKTEPDIAVYARHVLAPFMLTGVKRIVKGGEFRAVGF